MLDIVIGQTQNVLAQHQLLRALRNADLNGTLYTGYPIIASADEMVMVDALLTCRECGLVVINFLDPALVRDSAKIQAKQDDLYTALNRKLLEYKPLVPQRKLVVDINVLTFAPFDAQAQGLQDVPIAGPASLLNSLKDYAPISENLLHLVNAAIQRVATIKPATKRNNVVRSNSRGAIIQQIEKEIANLDQWQKKAAVELPQGPQRIRGLAGSGKTIVLALKAAYLHAANPDWDIAVTFHTRALYQQFMDLIRRFCFEHKNDEPDWTKLRIMHAWGSNRRPGVYSEIAGANNLPIQDLTYARLHFSSDTGFAGICDELLASLKLSSQPNEMFDAVLIDEAQDLPRSFFEICYLSARHPKRVVWAYDELQNLGAYSMAPPAELFGSRPDGQPNVPNLDSEEDAPKRDIVLPVCYRNTPWALTTAHAVGFGVYREKGLVQFFENTDIWRDIGYHIRSGSLEAGQVVELERASNSFPSYFAELLDSSDSVQWNSFKSQEDQAAWVAGEVQRNLTEDELKHTDILIVVTNPLTARRDASYILAELNKYGIPAHLAGVTSSLDRLYQEGSVAISGIYRAKGNEAAMVYILDADYTQLPYTTIRSRNVLFTAITRSRAWVRVCGCGSGMDVFVKELEAVKAHEYRLRFKVPTDQEMERMRKIHRDKTPAEVARQKDAINSVEGLLEMVEAGDLDPDEIPEPLKRRLGTLFGVGNDG
jgi:superfamily I DNA and RNA helicase